jgi:signal peptide peptidase SppA
MIQKILNKPLMIAPQSLEAISNAEWFESDDKMISTIYGGVAIIPIHGLLTKSASFFSLFLEMASYEDIGDAIGVALDDSDVNSILLDIDSPGGEVSGLFDLVDFIYASRNEKPIYAIDNDHAFSAAYAIASAASKIFVNRTSGVGSIGVIASHVDVSEMDKKAGIKYTTIFAGDRKNDLSPHEPLSDDATADLQKEVDRLYGMFVATVARNRGISEASVRSTEAGLFYGNDAVAIGLADGIANYDLVLDLLNLKGERIMTTAFKTEVPEITEDEQPEPEKNVEGNEILEVEKSDERELEPDDNEGTSKKVEEDGRDIERAGEESETAENARCAKIAQLCGLAGASDRIHGFITAKTSLEDVKKELLAAIGSKQIEISSAIPVRNEKIENPMIAEAKARADRYR